MAKKIDQDTQIVFSVKAFLGTIFSILGIFFGFYMLVVVPKIEAVEKHYIDMYQEQKDQNMKFYEELNKINNAIGNVNGNVNAINEKLKENNSYNIVKSNTKGSLGEN